MQTTGTLEITTPSEREIEMTREFNAPAALVFDAYTTPRLVKRWLLGPPGWTMPVCEIDLRVGGSFRYVWRGADGTEMGMGGVYREIERPGRLVHTELFDEDWTGGETLVTTTFTERDGRTRLRSTVLYASREARDAAVATGMAEGVEVSYDRLEGLLESIERGEDAAASTRAGELAARFEAVNGDAIAAVTRATDEQWRRECSGEGWPVAVVAHHIAAVHGDFVGLVGALAAGEMRSPGDSMDAVYASNAEHARAYAGVGKRETIDALRANGAELARLIRGIDDDRLDAVAGVFGGREMTVGQVVEWIVIGHAQEHLNRLRGALEG